MKQPRVALGTGRPRGQPGRFLHSPGNAWLSGGGHRLGHRRPLPSSLAGEVGACGGRVGAVPAAENGVVEDGGW